MFNLFPTSQNQESPRINVLIISNDGKTGFIDSESNLEYINTLINAQHSHTMRDELKNLLQRLNEEHIEYQIEFVNPISDALNINLEKTAEVINNRKVDLVLISDDMDISTIDLAEHCINSTSDEKPKVCIIGDASVHINKMIEHTNFSGAVGIDITFGENKESLLKQSYGQANQGANIPNTLDTKFNVASVSKMLTAVGIAKLVEEGKLKYDDFAADFLPENTPRHIKEYFSKNDITVNELMTHTSGLSQVYFEILLKSDMLNFNSLNNFLLTLSNEDILSTDLAKRGVFQYSNINYLILGCIIEQAAGKNYYSYMNNDIFGPEMKNTVSTNEAGPSFAVGYTELQPLDCAWLENIATESPHLKETVSELHRLLEIYSENMTRLFQFYQSQLASIHSEENLESFKEELKNEINNMFKLIDNINSKIVELKQSHLNTENIDKLANLFDESSFTGAPFLLFSLINSLSIAQPGGYWRSSIDDLLIFSEALWSKKILNDPQTLTAEKISTGLTRAIDPSYYAKGICIWGDGITLCIGHDGAGPGSRATLRNYPNAGITLVTVSNVENENADTLKNRLAKYLVDSQSPESSIQLLDGRINKDPNVLANNIKNIMANKVSNHTEKDEVTKETHSRKIF